MIITDNRANVPVVRVFNVHPLLTVLKVEGHIILRIEITGKTAARRAIARMAIPRADRKAVIAPVAKAAISNAAKVAISAVKAAIVRMAMLLVADRKAVTSNVARAATSVVRAAIARMAIPHVVVRNVETTVRAVMDSSVLIASARPTTIRMPSTA